MTYFFETYGCQMNQAESAGIAESLAMRGWKSAESADACDLLIVNTCSVRITAETRVFGRLAHFSAMKKKSGRDFFIMVIGCMAERLGEDLQKKFPLVDYVVGVSERRRFDEIFARIEKKVGCDNLCEFENEYSNIALSENPVSTYVFSKTSYNTDTGGFQSYVPIMNGCNNFCSFCIVPYVRGREVSRSVESILHEIELLSDKGVKEITLLGQNVNSYRGVDNDGKKIDFPALLRLIARKCEESDSIRWIRFMSSHPKDMSDDLITVIAEEERVCNLVHLPMQHGSNPVLKRMNRRYTIEHYLSLIEKLKQRVEGLALSTDILIGFPDETDEDLEATLEVMRGVEFNSAFMYHYNPREKTKAFDFPNRIPDKTKIERLQRVIDLQMKITERKMLEKIGSETIVLVESHSRNNPDELFGHTECGEMVVIEGMTSDAVIGNFVGVRLDSLRGKTFRAKKLS
ncbi:MAG: tRNA (N6-isopentenyl adenosine(37)-C2)-methylthiotransferase MiaB [Treponema sp.]|nr:MAG: tRNA (N6-isopentenyl adenosine(37)-C2)-methylthiotransferase MiaB [Treponema sp.]